MKENNPKVNYNNTVTLSEVFPGSSDRKASAHNAGDQGSIPKLNTEVFPHHFL